MNAINKIIPLSLILLILPACHLDYKQAQTEDELSETVPETILLNITQTKVEKGRMASKLEAEQVETYKNKNQMEVKNLHYLEVDDEGNPLTEGWADASTYFTDTENAEISGDVFFYSETEQVGIYAQSLNWNNETKVLTSPATDTVTVAREDGSYVKGTGFQADLSLKEITFSTNVEGVYIDEDETE